MVLIASWVLFGLGIAHVLFGIVAFKPQFQAAMAEGFVGKFSASDDRRIAFWFTVLGPPIALIGFVAIHSVATQDLGLLKIIGFTLLGTAVSGVLAFPKSPLWLLLLLSPFFILGGYGLIH